MSLEDIFYDCHIHYYGENVKKLKKIIENSKYASKYMCYHSINYNQLEREKNIDSNRCYFMMPFVLKETSISMSNQRLLCFSCGHNNVMQVPLLGDQMEHYSHFKSLIGLKEHFLLHPIDKCEERKIYYDFLNDNELLLILHCKDVGRIEYISELREKFPKMYIQIAHLGVNRRDINKTKILLEKFSKDDHVYYDVSTVFDFRFIAEVCPMISKQLLFGTDAPYVTDESLTKQVKFYQEQELFLLKCMNYNAYYLLKKLKKET